MPKAEIVISQTGAAGPPGIARRDLVIGGADIVFSNSVDGDVGVATWEWTLIERPPGSMAALVGTNQPSCTLTPDITGRYVVALRVNGLGDHTPGYAITVAGCPYPSLGVLPSGDQYGDWVLPSFYERTAGNWQDFFYANNPFGFQTELWRILDQLRMVTIPSISSDVHAAKTIVGNALAGDTTNDCHVLDAGDGVLLAATITAATTGADIYVRPGVYDFNAGDIGSVVIPSGVRVRGAGWGHTIISCSFGHEYGDNHAFMLMSEATLEDVGIFCPTPTIAQSPWAYYVVECYGYGATVSRVRILFDNYWNAIQGYGTNYFVQGTLGAFGSGSGGVDYTALQPNRFVDCEAHKVPYDPDGSGSDVIDWIDCYVNEGGFVWLSASAVFSQCYGEGGRRGVYVSGQAIVDHCHVVNEVSGYYEGIYGYLLSIDDNGQLNVSTNKVTMSATAAESRGIYIYAYCSTFHGNTVVVPTGKFGGAHPSAIAIHVASGQLNNVVSNIASGWEHGILLDNGADNNIVVGNNLGTIATLVDNGTSNEKGHNIYGFGIPV